MEYCTHYVYPGVTRMQLPPLLRYESLFSYDSLRVSDFALTFSL